MSPADGPAAAQDEAIRRMWLDYAASGHRGRPDGVLVFGDTASMADELADLVLHGPKRATAGLVAGYEADGDPPPRAGEHLVLLDGSGSPRAVVRLTEVRTGPMSSVDDAFAWDEAEGDRSRESWLTEHRAFFSRACVELGLAFDDDVSVHFERFDVVWPTALSSGDVPFGR